MDLGCDRLRDALETLLHKSLPLETDVRQRYRVRQVKRGRQIDNGQTDRETDLRVEGSCCVQEEFTDFMHAVSVTGGVLQTGEESTANSHRTL